VSVSSTRMDTLVRSSFCRRSRRSREVRYVPSLPESGLLLTVKIIASVGSSISSGFQRHRVGQIRNAFPDVIALDAGNRHQIACGDSLCFVPFQASEGNRFGDSRRRPAGPSSLTMPTSAPRLSVPLKTRPIAMRPEIRCNPGSSPESAELLGGRQERQECVLRWFRIAGAVFRAVARREVRHAVARIRVHHRKVELVFRGVEIR